MKILLNSIYPYLFAALIFVLPFDHFIRAWPNILLGVLAVSFPFIVQKSDFKKIDKKLGILLLLFFCYLLANTLMFNRWEDNNRVIERAGIAIGLVLLYIPIRENRKLDNAVIFSSMAAIIYSVFNIMMLIKDTGEFNFANNENPWNALLIDRLYLGLLSIYSIIISFKNTTKTYNQYNKYYLFNIVVNIAFLFIIVARMALITLIVMFILWFFYHKVKKKAMLVGGVIIAIIVASTFLINDNMAKRFFYQTEYNSEKSLLQKTLDWEPRTVIWACGAQIIEEGNAIFSGLGFRSADKALVECYKTADINEGRRDWFLFKEYNSHNQFLDFYLSAGIISCILFLAIITYLFIKARKDYATIALVLALFLFISIENIFHRQIGAYYFGVVLIYLCLHQRGKGMQTTNPQSLE